jgi:hypothetical protein
MLLFWREKFLTAAKITTYLLVMRGMFLNILFMVIPHAHTNSMQWQSR